MTSLRAHQKLQLAMDEIHEITGLHLVLYSDSGTYLASTTGADEGFGSDAAEFASGNDDEVQKDGWCRYKVCLDGEIAYVLFMEQTSADAMTIGRMAVCQLRNIAASFAAQYDRTNFIQNVLLGNMLTVDIFSQAKKLHVEPAKRAVFVIDTGKKSNDIVMELVKNLSDLKAGDFVTSIDEHSVILVKDMSAVAQEELDETMESIAIRLLDNLHMEAMIKVRVGYGCVVEQVPDIAQSFQEAKMAIEVGKVFYAECDTVSYSKLGIGRLIYQLPLSLCDMYIKEVFGEQIPDILDDEEAMSTITKFFENNLNISETARQLYVHRNTLVYRLERIEKALGLDIRSFDDAMTFKLAMMVIAHVRAQREKGV